MKLRAEFTGLRKRLDLEEPAQATLTALPAVIVRKWSQTP